MTCTRSLIRVALIGAAAAALLGGSGLPHRRPRTRPSPPVLSAPAPGEPGPSWPRWWR
jgi:hypothetical protein